jgi:hypothetical protein
MEKRKELPSFLIYFSLNSGQVSPTFFKSPPMLNFDGFCGGKMPP